MTAREKFEELGYKYSYVDGRITNEMPYIEYLEESGNSWERITFPLPMKRVFVSASYNGHGYPAPLSLEEIKAIEEQCIELGWDKE